MTLAFGMLRQITKESLKGKTTEEVSAGASE